MDLMSPHEIYHENKSINCMMVDDRHWIGCKDDVGADKIYSVKHQIDRFQVDLWIFIELCGENELRFLGGEYERRLVHNIHSKSMQQAYKNDRMTFTKDDAMHIAIEIAIFYLQ